MIYNITPNDKLNSILNKALENKADKSDLESKADKYTSGGGFEAGKNVKAYESSIAIGVNASAGDIYETGQQRPSIAIGAGATASEGIAIGVNAIGTPDGISIGDGAEASGGSCIQLGNNAYYVEDSNASLGGLYSLNVYKYRLMYGNGYIPAERQYVSGIYYIYGWDGNIAKIYNNKNGWGEPFEFDLNTDSEVSLYLDEITDEAEQIKLVEIWSELNLVGVGKQLKAFGLADPSTMLNEAITIPIMIKVVLK